MKKEQSLASEIRPAPVVNHLATPKTRLVLENWTEDLLKPIQDADRPTKPVRFVVINGRIVRVK